MPRLENITKKFGELTVFENFNLEIKDGITTAILGNSGIGKTTLLNIISGLLPYSGNVEKDGRTAYVFQEPRLIETMTVRQNLLFVMKSFKLDKEFLEREVEKFLKLGELADKKNSYPSELSGGQKQRVSLIRGFLYPAKLLLMDEPFSSLDLPLKMRLMNLYTDLLREKPKTTILVSHDIDECLLLADEIIVLGHNRVVYRDNLPHCDAVRDIKDEKFSDMRNNIYNALLSER